jgi:putative pyruvate formate lyase activating enzyme
VRPEPSYLALERSGELKQREEALWAMLESCRLCPRECGVNRLHGETGICSSGRWLKVFSSGPHFGEEPPLVGRSGSGTIFFSNCNLLCVYCQNWEINHRGDGTLTNHNELSKTMLRLQASGCHNINLVTPTHIVPHIVKGLRIAARQGLRLPLVYNTGGYDSLEVLRLLDGVVDIYLPDFKYQDSETAARFSADAPGYAEAAAAAIAEMHRQVGVLQVVDGVATRGLLIRHLVLPENLAGTDRFVRWVAAELGCDTRLNIMAQYRPMHRAREFPPLHRRLTREEYAQALRWAREAGLQHLTA